MLNSDHIAIDFYHKEGDPMKKLTYLLAIFAFLAASLPLTLGLAAVFDWFLKKFDRSVLKIGKS